MNQSIQFLVKWNTNDSKKLEQLTSEYFKHCKDLLFYWILGKQKIIIQKPI